jgi:hypothetical protein
MDAETASMSSGPNGLRSPTHRQDEPMASAVALRLCDAHLSELARDPRPRSRVG